MLKKNITKPVFVSRSSWVKVQLYEINFKKHLYLKFVSHDRNSTITENLLKKDIKIKTGCGWKKRIINEWMVGFKLGSLTKTRKKWQKKIKKNKKNKKK